MGAREPGTFSTLVCLADARSSQLHACKLAPAAALAGPCMPSQGCVAAGVCELDDICMRQVYMWTGNWRFKVMDRKEVQRQAVAVRMTALDGGAKSGAGGGAGGGNAVNGGAAAAQDAGTLHDLENGARCLCRRKCQMRTALDPAGSLSSSVAKAMGALSVRGSAPPLLHGTVQPWLAWGSQVYKCSARQTLGGQKQPAG